MDYYIYEYKSHLALPRVYILASDEKMKVLVVGSLNIDQVVVTVQGLPKPGETVFGKDRGVFYGGKGANQAVAVARLASASSCRLIGAIGGDEEGRRYLRDLETKEKVLVDKVVQVMTVKTGFAAVTVSGSEGENTVSILRLYSARALGLT
jgi:ribokinase